MSKLSRRRASLAAVTVGLLITASLSVAQADEGTISFEQHIRPILKVNCFQCHGEDKELAGGLDLRLRRLIVDGGDSGPAISPSDHVASLLVDYVQSGEMPPAEEQQLQPDEVALIVQWIDAGAPTLRSEPDTIPPPGAFVITPEERSHWAFQPIQRPPVPATRDSQFPSENAIDAFILDKLQAHELSFSPQADKLTLIRRATFDLIGLPPTPEEVDRFLADESPQAFDNLIDRLLDSPHYGERWARHWLDVAGYADSEGYNDDDAVRPDAWRYRDYVIRALNSDKPWNDFIVEQLAGDELVRATHANAQGLANRDPEACEKLTATGFLRLAPDGTGSRPMDLELAKNQVITETINIVSSSLLGMTVGCAECHHHRYDPIPQDDFYRLRAVIAPVFDSDNWRVPNARRAALLSEADREKADEIEARAKEWDAQHDALKQQVVEQIFERELESVPEEKQPFAREAFETPANKRSAEQQEFLQEEYPMLRVSAGTLHLFLAKYKDGDELKKGYEEAKAKAEELRGQKPQPDLIRVATEDTKHVPETFLFYRGDITSPEPNPVPPGGLTILDDDTLPENDPELPTTGRRLAFARDLTSGRHPLVARVLVNRFWMHHFGRALVESTGDFGQQGAPPSHPELLDWLAADFMHNGWRLKRLHKQIMTSHAYRQTSTRRPKAEAVDVDNRLLWRMPVRRLEAEAVRDSILAVSSTLDRRPFGPPVSVGLDEGGIITVSGSDAGGVQKRSLYVQVRRTQPLAMLEAFDAPQMEPNCERRTSSTVAVQALALLNSQFVVSQAEAFADRVLAETGDASEQVAQAWKIALGRTPSSLEIETLLSFLEAQTDEFRSKKIDKPERQALASLCQVLFGANQFLYID